MLLCAIHVPRGGVGDPSSFYRIILLWKLGAEML